uniref:Uncharacterized protein n=1 Tax=viral metagenome TaxID=1070528 RepID=A0A6C0JKY7_9ZZZZ
MKITTEYLVVGALIVYIAFFTHPPPRFVTAVLESPVGQVLVLLGVVGVFIKSQPIGLLCGVAYLVSSYPVLEHLDATEQGPKKEQPKSGAPKPSMADIGKLAGMLSGKGQMTGKGQKLPQEAGKDVTTPPASTNAVKPHSDPKVTEKFSLF